MVQTPLFHLTIREPLPLLLWALTPMAWSSALTWTTPVSSMVFCLAVDNSVQSTIRAALSTDARGINSQGDIVGVQVDVAGLPGGGDHGYLTAAREFHQSGLSWPLEYYYTADQ